MNETQYREGFHRRWSKRGGVICRIPDSPMTGIKPFDSMGLALDGSGKGIAFEFKVQEGGLRFPMNQVAPHQIKALTEWHRKGGVALLVVGWRPKGGRFYQDCIFRIEDILLKTSLVLATGSGLDELASSEEKKST